ncbi:MAG TPA: hypothetical protein GX523_18130 [Desulfitobacterium dehalogenans]|uniref:EamA family transporter n=1 Tax=Desulfitobacterium dehalogenans TaxID=36854 RepID=A0A7C7DCQ2_9FIRM|nr:hypothetical protein [Desulfitobacterium dehalogenans]
MTYLLLSVNIVLLVAGQTLWKLGMQGASFKLGLESVLRCMLNPYVLSGLLVYAAATVIWLYLLAQNELSMLYPLQSLCYVAAAFVAMFVFQENLPLTRWFGLSLIIAGAYFVSR